VLTGLSGSPASISIRFAHKHKPCAQRPVVTILEAAIDSLALSFFVMESISVEIRKTFDLPRRPQTVRENSATEAVVVTIGFDAPGVLYCRRMND
jgi:hypothetical protein